MKFSLKEIYNEVDKSSSELAAKHAYLISSFFNSLAYVFSYGLLKSKDKKIR